MTDCVFCAPNWDNLDLVDEIGPVAIIRPLDPVTPGHVLVIHGIHSQDAAASSVVAADLMAVAAEYVARNELQANIITSVGPLATQTVFHTHVHVVPRRENDGLPLPWTPQHELKRLQELGLLKTALAESGYVDSYSMGIFQQQSSPYTLSAMFPKTGPKPLRSPEQQEKLKKLLEEARDNVGYLATEGISYDDE